MVLKGLVSLAFCVAVPYFKWGILILPASWCQVYKEWVIEWIKEHLSKHNVQYHLMASSVPYSKECEGNNLRVF